MQDACLKCKGGLHNAALLNAVANGCHLCNLRDPSIPAPFNRDADLGATRFACLLFSGMRLIRI